MSDKSNVVPRTTATTGQHMQRKRMSRRDGQEHPRLWGRTFVLVVKMRRLNLLVTVLAAVLAWTALVPEVVAAPPPLPTLEEERAAYRSWGWTWTADVEPNVPADPLYAVVDPDIHYDTEGDDLWSYLMMYQRTGEPGYLDRAQAWARYFKQDYRVCVSSDPYWSFCYDRDAFGADHMWGWGLVAWYEVMGDPEALAEAVRLAEVVETMHSPGSNFGCYSDGACLEYGPRGVARHLLLVTRVAEATSDPRWIALRDRIVDRVLAAPEWDPARGMYFVGAWQTDYMLWAGAYEAGARVQSTFQIGWLTEALYQRLAHHGPDGPA